MFKYKNIFITMTLYPNCKLKALPESINRIEELLTLGWIVIVSVEDVMRTTS